MKKLLMCRPDHFTVSYDINPWMKDGLNKVDHRKALKQWEKLYDAISKVAKVKLIDPAKNNPDMVFTANGGLVHKNMVFLPYFKHEERSKEEKLFENWFADHSYLIIKEHFSHFEGEGDCLKDSRGNYWMGHGFRTNKNYGMILKTFGLKVETLKLVDPRFYHLDTCFLPLPDGGVMYYPAAFSAKSQSKIIQGFSDSYVIEVIEKEALTFCCNSVIIDKEVFMPQCESVFACESIASTLSAKGYKVHQFDMSEFLKSGGACKCLVLTL